MHKQSNQSSQGQSKPNKQSQSLVSDCYTLMQSLYPLALHHGFVYLLLPSTPCSSCEVELKKTLVQLHLKGYITKAVMLPKGTETCCEAMVRLRQEVKQLEQNLVV